MPGSASSHGIPVWWLLRPFVAFEKTTQSMLAPWQCTFVDTSPPGRCLRKLDFLPKPASCRSCMWTLDTLRTISSIAPELQHLGLNLGLTGVRARMVLMQCTSCTFHMRLRGKV
eukprot:scaffold13465_cov20-Tisochrysis_lutea.AAC.1